jgi:hypothetical protein
MAKEIVRLLGSILPGSSLLQTAAAVDENPYLHHCQIAED